MHLLRRDAHAHTHYSRYREGRPTLRSMGPGAERHPSSRALLTDDTTPRLSYVTTHGLAPSKSRLTDGRVYDYTHYGM
jgi:hypothetical protein